MKTRNITLLTAIAAAAALAPTAQAAITATGNFDLLRTQPGQPWLTIDSPDPGDWKVDYFDGSLGAGTLNVAGGNLFDANGQPVSVGWGAGTSTITVTGPGSELRNSGRFVVGNNASHGDLIVEAGGLVNVQDQIMIGKTGLGTALVTGASSKLTTNTLLQFGQQTGGAGSILTVEDSGLVQVKAIKFGFDPSGGYLHMGVGGVLAVEGDHTGAGAFANGGLFTIQGAGSFGEIQYDNGGTWENMAGATEGVDYTLALGTGGLDGYTVLTMLDTTTPAADLEITSISYDQASEQVTLTWTSSPNRTYAVFFSDDLNFDTDVDDSVVSAGDTTSLTFSNPAPGARKVFFRISENGP